MSDAPTHPATPEVDGSPRPLQQASAVRPSIAALMQWINRIAAAQLRYRLLMGAALSLAISECTLAWLAQRFGLELAAQTRALASTVYYCFGLAIAAGWFGLGGWLDSRAARLFEELAVRRGFDGASCKRIEMFAYWRWMSFYLGLPVVPIALVGMIRGLRLPEFLAVLSNLLLALLFTQVLAAAVVAAVVAMRKLELRTARRAWLLACVVPELLRPFAPGFPTLRSLASATEHLILRWGAGG